MQQDAPRGIANPSRIERAFSQDRQQAAGPYLPGFLSGLAAQQFFNAAAGYSHRAQGL